MVAARAVALAEQHPPCQAAHEPGCPDWSTAAAAAAARLQQAVGVTPMACCRVHARPAVQAALATAPLVLLAALVPVALVRVAARVRASAAPSIRAQYHAAHGGCCPD